MRVSSAWKRGSTGRRVELAERFRKFHLALHPEKTRLLEFGPYAAENRTTRGLGKPETFTFLGFTHSCGKKRRNVAPGRGRAVGWRGRPGGRCASIP